MINSKSSYPCNTEHITSLPSTQKNRYKNVNITPLSLCPSPSNKKVVQTGNKQFSIPELF